MAITRAANGTYEPYVTLIHAGLRTQRPQLQPASKYMISVFLEAGGLGAYYTARPSV